MKALNIFTTLAIICMMQLPNAFAGEKMTTYERQVNLMKRVNDAQKSKELTVKQAKGLRKDLSNIASKKQKIRDAKPGKDQSENTKNIEERLTEISEKIEELKKDNIEDKK